ncbi:MAG TPA: tol-pal system protein YbgF [Alphaproteobacteria bacterium]
MRLSRFALLAGVATVFFLPAGAFAQNNDMRAVSQRLAQMERQMSQMSRDMYKDGGAAASGGINSVAPIEQGNASLAAATDARLSTLEGELRRINNRLDEQDYSINQLKSQFELFRSDLEVRLSEISGQKPAGTGPVSSATPVEPSPDATSTTPSSGDSAAASGLNFDNPATLYDQAFQALREQNYTKAQQGFDGFLQRYPKDQLAGNAKYWLGETYYVRGDYTRAARVFAEGYQQYPKSSKGPDNLLKLGISLSQLNKKQEACVTFAQLDKDYKNAAGVIKQRADAEKQKLGC